MLRYIANMVRISQSIVSRICARYEGECQRRSGQDRRHITTPRENRIIVRHVRAKPFINANVIASRIQNSRQQSVHQISEQTIRNCLRDAHLRSYRSLQIPT